jgi:hypothetical protein
VLFGCYRAGDANDPETYSAAVAAVLATYPPDVVKRVTDPRTGLPGRSKWLPTVSEVRDECERLAAQEVAAIERQARIERQLAERAAEDALRAAQPRPTLEELKAKHGENWGLKIAEEDSEAKKKANEQMAAASRKWFERECERAGVDPARGYSPSLAAIIKGTEA